MSKKGDEFQLVVVFPREVYLKLIILAKHGELSIPELVRPEREEFQKKIIDMANRVQLDYTVDAPQKIQVSPSTDPIPVMT